MTVVAIHQPNFLPWLGYFAKIAHSDQFVFLDHVQYSKTGGTWSNRVKMRVANRAQWITAPIHRSQHGVLAVREVCWDDSRKWRDRTLKTLASSYGRVPFFAPTMELIEPIICLGSNNLAEFNICAIRSICTHISLDTKHCIRSSGLDVHSQSNQMLVELVKKFGADTYLCGGGASGYMDEQAFKRAGLSVRYQDFLHPQYPQDRSEFISGLSIIDALMNIGADNTRQLIG